MLSANWDPNQLKNGIFLAPMEGVVDYILREMITSHGVIDICTTEFIRVTHQLLPEKLFYKYAPELHTESRTSAGTPVFVQLLGSDPILLTENALRALELGAFGIDLNFGCPAKRVNQHDGGANLLKTPERIFNIISYMRDRLPKDKALTAKVRLGFDNKDYVTDIATAVSDGGATALIVHARTKIEGYKPPAHWDFIYRMKEVAKIPLIANGEIWTLDDYNQCRLRSGCEHVMIGRGLVANPALSCEIKLASPSATWQSYLPYLLKFADKNLSLHSDSHTVKRLKQLIRIKSQSFAEAMSLFEKIKTFNQATPLLQTLQKEIDNPSVINYLEAQKIVPKYI